MDNSTQGGKSFVKGSRMENSSIEISLEEVLEFEKKWILSDDDSFVTKYENKENEFVLQSRKLKNARTMTLRASIVIEDCSVEEFGRMHLDSEYNAVFDTMSDEFRVLKRLSDHTDISYYRSKAICYVFYPRDFVMTRYYGEIHPGVQISLSRSLKDDRSILGEQSGVVRGFVHFLSFYFHPHSKNEKNLQVTYIVNCDQRGILFPFVVDFLLFKFAPMYVKNLLKAVKNYPEWRKKKIMEEEEEEKKKKMEEKCKIRMGGEKKKSLFWG